MKSFFTILSLISLVALSGCKNDTQKTFAIRDFKKSLQPYLTKLVSTGIVGYDPAARYIEKHATDNELIQLSHSEHPVLRAVAFREMLDRSTFNHFDLMMNHLDDTAIVTADEGEWGLKYVRVSDNMLEYGKWKDTLAKQKTIEEIIKKHNFLSAAYLKCSYLEPTEIYYPYIKKMAERERSFIDNFSETEHALYGLARYRKDEDIAFIKQSLLSNVWRISGISFGLMEQFPNETYLDVYEKFFPRGFYRETCKNQNLTLGESFINSIAKYKNERSEKILSSILNRKPFMSCIIDTSYLKRELVYAIWNNPCKSYLKIRSQVESSVKRYEEISKKCCTSGISLLEADTILFQKDASNEPVRWWR